MKPDLETVLSRRRRTLERFFLLKLEAGMSKEDIVSETEKDYSLSKNAFEILNKTSKEYTNSIKQQQSEKKLEQENSKEEVKELKEETIEEEKQKTTSKRKQKSIKSSTDTE